MRNWREEIRRDIHERMTTSQMYAQDPETAEQEVTLDTIADITKDAQDDGRDTTGIFDDFGNSMFVDPPSMSADQYNSWTASYGGKYFHKVGYTSRDIVPTSVNDNRSDGSKSPGPLCWYYNSSEDRTYIGFLRQSDRGFNRVARFDGDWDDWNESDHSGTNYFGGNNYLVSSFDAEDVSWLKTERAAGRTSDFRAFVDDNDMTDTDSHGRINVNMINTIKGDYTNYWSVFNADEPVLSDTKITLKFHFRTNSYWRYFGNYAVDSNPSSINTGSDKAQRAKTPPPLPLFYDSNDETPTFYDSFNGRQVASYGMSGWDFLGELVDTVEFTVPQGGQLNANGNKIAGNFNINGIGLKWRYITAAENPDTAHPEPDDDQNGYNHTRNFPDVPFDDYLIWTISINGQDYDLRNGIEGLTVAIGIPGYTKEKWVKGPVNSRKGLPGFTNSYDNKKAIGNVNDMNLEGINQIMNLSKTIQQLKKKKKNIQFIQKNKLKKPTLNKPTLNKPTKLRRTQLERINFGKKSPKIITSRIKSHNSNLKKLTNGLSDSVKSDLGLDDTPKPSALMAPSVNNLLPSLPDDGISPPKPPSETKLRINLGLPDTEPLTPPDSKKPPEGKEPPTPPDDEKLPERPKFVDRYKQNREMNRRRNIRERKSYERTWPTITEDDIHEWEAWAAKEGVSVETVYDRAVIRYYLSYEKYTYSSVINPQLRYDVRALTDYYNIDSLKPQKSSPPQVWEWRMEDLENLIKAMVKNHQNEFKYLGMPADWYQMTSTSHMDFLKGKQEANVRWWEPKIKSRMDELKRMKEEYAELFGGPPPDSAMGDGDSSGPGEGEGGPEGLDGEGGPEGNPDAEPLTPEVENADNEITDKKERGLVDKAKDAILDLAANILGVESAKNTLDAYNEFLKNPKGPGSSPDNPLDITDKFSSKDKNILKDSIKNKNVQDKINNALNSASKGESPKSQDLRWDIAADAVEGALNGASAKSDGLNNTLYGGAKLDRARFIESGGKDIVLNKTYVFRPGGSVADAEASPLGQLATGVGLNLDTLGASGNPAVVIGGVVASQLMLGNSNKYGGPYKSPPAHMQVNVSGSTVKESLEKWEKKLIKEDIDLPKKNFFEMDRSDIWRKQDKTKNMIASREKGMRVDQRMAYSRFFTADSQNKLDKTLNSVKQQFNYQGKPAANGFPDQPPKEIGKDGFTKDYGQRDGYYNKLDPISANTMQHVGNHDPNMQKKVDSARQDSRLKQRDRILSNFKKVVDRA